MTRVAAEAREPQATLERLLREVTDEKYRVEGEAFGRSSRHPGLTPEVDWDALDRLHRIYKVRIDRLEQLIEKVRG